MKLHFLMLPALILLALTMSPPPAAWAGQHGGKAGGGAAGGDKDATKPASPGASGLPTPRFVSLASRTVHMRAGPGVRYPITWIYRRFGTPLMVMAEYEYWRKVRDVGGTEGWIHRSLLSGRRTAVVLVGITDLRKRPDAKAPVILRAEAGVIGELLACKKSWCQLELRDTDAWLPRAAIFGTLPNEQF